MLKNRVGLEAEFLLQDKDGNLVSPNKYGFGTDDFPLIGEMRGEVGETRADSLANFMKSYYSTVQSIKEQGLILNIDGWKTISPALYRETMKSMGTKEVSRCLNIYDTEILDFTDDLADTTGKLIGHNVSCGLHVHFSSDQIVKMQFEYDASVYDEVNVPFFINEKIGTSFKFYSKKNNEIKKKELIASASVITKPVIKHIVEFFDSNLLHIFKEKELNLKFRMPGFYELKPYGFEYRSLPFNLYVFENLYNIVDAAFTCLESL